MHRYLYSAPTVDAINRLALPAYGLGDYLSKYARTTRRLRPKRGSSSICPARGKRLKGFCRTNLFKRLESSGLAFMLSIEPHILRNHVYLHGIESGLPLPIGTQDASLLDARFTDSERDLYSDEYEENDEATNGEVNGLDLGIEARIRTARRRCIGNTRERGRGDSAGLLPLVSSRSSLKTFSRISTNCSA